ncbi:ribonuclease HII [Arthrobacter sp. zg-Y786]|uniref:Ribonuclease n=1 Tax=Arthrobacter gengyunqii TaxID=2886940 RepID=A0ABS8GJI5_9MICC|nr:ribonuclease HII [Arthrobacter gengyunqii]
MQVTAVSARPRPKTGAGSKAPTLRHERSFAAVGYKVLAGCDEVGRGALAGPVSVGLVAVDLATVRSLKGVRDSKLLCQSDRETLAPQIKKWARGWGVGHASAAEIDLHGIMGALRLAGTRAWDRVCADLTPDVVLLDGNYNWLSPARQASLFDLPGNDDGGCQAPVHTKIKADMTCLSVAAASVLAKVERDTMMVDYAVTHPQYGWEVNKGYATASHRLAIDEFGPTPLHRMSWQLGTRPEADARDHESVVGG